MLDMRQYKMGLDIWGLLLFVFMMAPNMLWFILPAPNDILTSNSLTPTIDMAASYSSGCLFCFEPPLQKTCT